MFQELCATNIKQTDKQKNYQQNRRVQTWDSLRSVNYGLLLEIISK